jgi:hypothetical protein
VIDLGGKIQSPQRHAEQEPQPGHDAVAGADAHARRGEMQLEEADVLKRGRVRGPLQKRSEPLTAADVAPLRSCTELARVHVLDHALAQRVMDSVPIGNTPVLEEVDDTSIFKTGRYARYRRSLPWLQRSQPSAPPPRVIAHRFSALARKRAIAGVKQRPKLGAEQTQRGHAGMSQFKLDCQPQT